MKTRMDSRQKAQLTINGDTLRKALAWAIDAKISANLKLHGNTNWAALRLAQKDAYKRKGSKKARYRPQTKDKSTTCHPKVVKATQAQKLKLKKYLKTLG